jgi:hypothetical protein
MRAVSDEMVLTLSVAGTADDVTARISALLKAGLKQAVLFPLAVDGDASGATNYIQIEVNHEELGPLTLTIQRQRGSAADGVGTSAFVRFWGSSGHWLSRRSVVIAAGRANEVIEARRCCRTPRRYTLRQKFFDVIHIAT